MENTNKRHLIGCPNIKIEGPCLFCDNRERDAARDEAMSYMTKKQRREALIANYIENDIDSQIEERHEAKENED